MIDKVVASIDEALADIPDGAVILLPGFAGRGVPSKLIPGLVRRGARNLTVVTNNCGQGREGDVSLLFKHGQVRKVYTSFPVRPGSDDFQAAYKRGGVEVVVVPQGTIAERLRAAGAGIGGFYTPTGVGTVVAEGKEVREFDGRQYVLERPLHGDYALIHAYQADRHGNLRYRRAARNFSPVMAMAAKVTIVEAEELVPLGSLDPEDIHTPGIFVDRVVVVGRGR